jgi:hypothetical protein
MKQIEIDRAAAAALAREGKTNTQIAKNLHRSIPFVRKWKERALDLKKGLKDNPREGRPRKIGPKVGTVLSRKFYGRIWCVNKVNLSVVDLQKLPCFPHDSFSLDEIPRMETIQNQEKIYAEQKNCRSSFGFC